MFNVNKVKIKVSNFFWFEMGIFLGSVIYVKVVYTFKLPVEKKFEKEILKKKKIFEKKLQIF